MRADIWLGVITIFMTVLGGIVSAHAPTKSWQKIGYVAASRGREGIEALVESVADRCRSRTESATAKRQWKWPSRTNSASGPR
jgi:hypothetical protein